MGRCFPGISKAGFVRYIPLVFLTYTQLGSRQSGLPYGVLTHFLLRV